MEKIIVSACLLGNNCKYDGSNNKNDKVLEYIKDKYVIPICPEVMGGLATPRIPAEIRDNAVVTKDNEDITDNFVRGANEVLYLAKIFKVKKALLKAKSPSCGVGEIYDGTFTHTAIMGDGFTTRLLKSNDIEVFTELDL